MNDELLLVGSIPLDTAEQVFRVFGARLGRWLRYLPDGEVGDRRYWIDGLAYRVFNGHPELETTRFPAPTEDGVENWKPLGGHDKFQFRVRRGIRAVRFGDPGWRLGYARDAVNSYAIFRSLKREGVIPAHLRFQVCLPLTYSAIGRFFPVPEDVDKVVDGLTAAFKAEVQNIVTQIPGEDLAIQWDLAGENRLVERLLEDAGLEQAHAEAVRVCRPAAEICSVIPAEVSLGYHSCFGTLDGWPSRQPSGLTGTVLLLNAVAAASGRDVDFVHFPTGQASGEDYFRPLADLDVGDARAYVGAIHRLDGADGLKRQVQLARKYLPEFGLAAPCGFGRAPERPGRLLTDDGTVPSDVVQAILDGHIEAVGLLAPAAHT